MEEKMIYEVRVSVNRYHALEYNTVSKKIESVLVSNEDEEGFGWFYTMFRSKKEAIKFFKIMVLSDTASEIEVELIQIPLFPSRELGESDTLCSINMSNPDMSIKEISKILRKVK